MSEKGGLKAALAAEIVAEIDALVGDAPVDGWDFEAIEIAARREALRIAGLAIARRFNADHSDHAGPSLPCPCGGQARYAGRHAKTFTSALGDLDLERAYFHCDRATCRRFENATRRVVLGDGAEWIWNIAAEQFPDAIQIVDRFHANEHLSDAAKAIYGPDGDLHKEWAHLRCTELKAGKIDDFLAAGRSLSRSSAGAGSPRRSCSGPWPVGGLGLIQTST